MPGRQRLHLVPVRPRTPPQYSTHLFLYPALPPDLHPHTHTHSAKTRVLAPTYTHKTTSTSKTDNSTAYGLSQCRVAVLTLQLNNRFKDLSVFSVRFLKMREHVSSPLISINLINIIALLGADTSSTVATTERPHFHSRLTSDTFYNTLLLYAGLQYNL